MSQLNLFMKRAKPKPVKIPAQMEEEAKGAMEPEEVANSVVVNSRPQVAAQTDSGPASPVRSTMHNSMSKHLPSQCQDCGKLGKTHYDNGGSFYSSADLCTKCIVKRYQPHGFKEPGFRIIEGETVEIVSHTTGLERIKLSWVREFFNSGMSGNPVFPVNVYLENHELKDKDNPCDHSTLGITWACARFLSARTGIPIPEDET